MTSAQSTPESPSENSQGLSAQQAAARLAQYGPNTLVAARSTPAWVIFVRQFSSVLVLILIGAAIIAAVMGEVIDTVAILLVVVLNGVLGFVQEWRAEHALEALRNLLSTRATVLRDGREQLIDAAEIVPGDLILIEAGDRVPADMTLVATVELQLDESVLTGESLPVRKTADTDSAQIFMGTSIVDGRGQGVVDATGMATRFGRIAALTGSVGAKKTQLQIKLARLARQLGAGAIAIAGFVILLGLMSGRDLVEVFMTGLSLAVAVVPEGLPAVVTITLALGAGAMVRQNALARRLQAVETLGAASVICTDKTGTLTENQMTVEKIWLPAGEFTATGTGYDPTGHLEKDGRPVRAGDDPDLGDFLETVLICNHARLHRTGDHWEMIGDPTEGALITLAYKGWTPLPDPRSIASEIPFNSTRKRMSVVQTNADGAILHMKGAPEVVLSRCTRFRNGGNDLPLDQPMRANIETAYRALADQGLRVIAAARGIGMQAPLWGPEQECDLTFLGLVGIIDPPRPEVRAAIAEARAAGIRIIMITGDGSDTAGAIAAALNLPVDHSITGEVLEAMPDAELSEFLNGDVLFARTEPHQKMRIVEMLQAQGRVVAMTGDGVNDAPALKRADIGIAMGIRGSDVAKDAADLVLLDDNFASIVGAIREGRRQFDNIRKFVRYLLASNAGEVVAIIANILIGGPLIFLATQILWMNLVTDGVTAITLGMEKGRPDQMRRPPLPRSAAIIGGRGFLTILAFGSYTGAASLFVFYSFLDQGLAVAQTAAFTAMVFFEKFSVFAFRSLSQPVLRIGFFSNPWLLVALSGTLLLQVAAVYWGPLQMLLRTAPLAYEHWQMIFALALPLVILPEGFKALRVMMQSRLAARHARA